MHEWLQSMTELLAVLSLNATYLSFKPFNQLNPCNNFVLKRPQMKKSLRLERYRTNTNTLFTFEGGFLQSKSVFTDFCFTSAMLLLLFPLKISEMK